MSEKVKKVKKTKRKAEDVEEAPLKKKARISTPRKSPRLAGVPASPGLGAFQLGGEDVPKEKKKKKKKKTSGGEEAAVEKEKKKKKKKAKAAEGEEAEEAEVEETPAPAERKTMDSKGNTFITEFPIHPDIQKKLMDRGMATLFPIQASCFKIAREGHDLIGRARTGTGKTLAFTLPVVQKLKDQPKNTKYGRLPRVLVLLPTRELAQQVGREFEAMSDLSIATMYGGTAYGPQSNAIRSGLDVVVGTTGRLKDLIERKMLKLDQVEHIILDEADEMLNMGFAEDVEVILGNIPRENREVQTLLFSATLPDWVQKIADKYLKPDRQLIDLVKTQKLKASNQVRHLCIPCHWTELLSVLGEVMMVYAGIQGRTIIFTETKKVANELAMSPTIKQECQPLHGDIPQAQRERTLKGFRDGTFRCLIATDVAARGLDIPGVDLVIQAEPPSDVETYIHRSGRTGRAGATGVAITFYGQKHRWYIEQIERKAGVVFEVTGVPQREEIMAASAKDAIRLLENVEPEVIQCFSTKAKELIEEKGAVPALAAALAHMAGHTKMLEARSLLTCGKGWVTVLVRTQTEVRSLSYIWNLIRRYLFEECDEKVRGMKFLADMKGAAFDIPQSELHLVKAAEDPRGQITFEVCKELPDTLEREAQRPEPRRWGNKGGRGGRSGGGRGGGRGRGGSGRGGGGRGRGRGSGRGGGSRGRGRGRW